MQLVFRLVGYDRATERLAVEYDIPPSSVAEAKKLVGVHPRYSGQLGDIPLDNQKTKRIAAMIGAPVDPSQFDYFLETYADERAHA